MNSSLINAAATILIIFLIGWLLYLGRSLLLPFVIALIVWYMIDTLARSIESVKVSQKGLPRWLTLLLALTAIGITLNMIVELIVGNLTALAGDAATYQARLEEILASVTEKLGLEEELDIREMLPDNILTQLATGMASALTTMAGSASLVFIYVIFLLFEQSTFDKKLRALFAKPEKTEVAFAMRQEIAGRVRHYVGIKTAVSILTGVLTSICLTLFGLPYAPLFGFIAFLLNYIPTIGSMIGVLFPAALALVFYDTLGPFFFITIVLGLIQFSIGNLLEPRLMGTSLNISPLIIMLSLAFWGAIWGVTGMVLCVPLTVIIMIVCAQFPGTRAIAVLLSEDGNLGDPIAADNNHG